MPPDLRLTVRFLQPYSHGRGADGQPEWPPSPLRLFQALVASSVGRQVDPVRRERTVEALRWLERQAAPEIVAPIATPTVQSYRLYVPDNVGDKVARAWSAGGEASVAKFRTEKDVRPMRLGGEAVHFLYRGPAEIDRYLPALRQAAHSLTHLGWGIDMVAGDAGDDLKEIEGERWLPGRHGGPLLRRAVEGTFDALERKHSQFLRRLDGGTFQPVSPLSVFASEPYARATDCARRPFAAFRLLEPVTADRLSLDPARRARDVAAWTRHAVAEVSEGWPFGSERSIVHGHGGAAVPGQLAPPRFSFLPLPTINPRLQRAEGIARVVIAGSVGLQDEIAWVRAHLSGTELLWNEEPVAVLEPLPIGDWVLSRYVGAGDRWSTATPVVLPGHHKGRAHRTEHLLLKAFAHAGFEPETLASIKELDWRKVGFRAGVDHASRYLAPDKVTGPLFHVRVRFSKPVLGPLAIGSGRFRGLGVFVLD